MVGKLWSSMFGRVVTDRQTPTDPSDREKNVMEEPALGMKLTGDPHPLDRLVSVQPNTVVVVFEQDSAPRLKLPGEYLTPGLLPSLRPVQVLAVNTAPVALDVTVDHLLTLDGHEIERCLVRVTVQLTDRDKYASVAGLAAEYGTELETYLLQRVETEVAMEMHAAVKMNRLADLRRQTVQQVMAERWLPKTFASGTLVRRDFAVIEVTWPKDSAIPGANSSAQFDKYGPDGLNRQAGTGCAYCGQDPGSIRHRIDHGCWAASDLASLCRTGAASHCRRQGRQFGNRSCRSRSRARCV